MKDRNGNEFIPYLQKEKAVLNDSIFLRYMKKHGVLADKRGFSKDFIVLKFSYALKDVITKKELRDYYYTNGATIEWEKKDKQGKISSIERITYRMLMRSPDKAKKGNCVFIREDLLHEARNFLFMGLYDEIPSNVTLDIVGLSAYSTLITATAIDFIKLPLSNILIVKDEEVDSFQKAVSVKTVQVDSKTQTCVDRQNQGKICNVLWDGMGLVDESVFPSTMEGFIYCRSHFFKSCLFRGNIQDYFKDYYGSGYETAYVTDMFGNRKKVSDILAIVTDKSIKWLKFVSFMGKTEKEAYSYYEKFMKLNGNLYEIVKTAHRSKWGELQRSSYQINNSLPCTDRNILKRIAETSIHYCNQLKINDEAFLRHLEITGAKYKVNDVLIALYRLNSKFRYTDYFRDKKKRIISDFKKKRLQAGKLFQYGDNLTICGNPVALLMKVTGQDFLKESCFTCRDDVIECYTTRFNPGEKLAGFRSPHNSPNNIVPLLNVDSAIIRKYFPKLGDNVIVINGIGTDVQSRLNSMDLDSDSVFVTNQKDIATLAEYSYKEYPTIINEIPLADSHTYKKEMMSFSDMDYKISSAQISVGQSTNLAQLALSYYFDCGCDNKKLEDTFIICSVLAQVAIDSAKRNYNIDIEAELKRLGKITDEERLREEKYPKFYAEIQNMKDDKRKIPKEQTALYDCPMDILASIIEEDVIQKNKHKIFNVTKCDMKEVFEYRKARSRDRGQIKKVIGIIEEYNKNVNLLNRNDEDYKSQWEREYEDCMSKINKLKLRKETMEALIDHAFHSDICDRLLTVLYNRDANTFLNCFKSDKNSTKSA